jgi:hypothetical protein
MASSRAISFSDLGGAEMICKLENYGLFLEGDLLFPRLIVF